MTRVPTRVLLFLSSYAPLFVLFAIRDSFKSARLQVVLVLVAFVSVATLFLYLHTMRRSIAAHTETVDEVASRDGDAMSYIVTYLLPFLESDFSDRSHILSFLLLMAILGILYVNSNMIHTNPILNLCGYHIFDLTVGGKPVALISRRSYIRKGTAVGIVDLSDYVALEGDPE